MSKTYFFTNPANCHACRIMDEVIEKHRIEGLITADITTSEGCVLATNFRLRGGLPTFMKVDDNGNVINQHSGTMSADGLKMFMED